MGRRAGGQERWEGRRAGEVGGCEGRSGAVGWSPACPTW